jgi:hypoxanthine phosphoribosyltransferase
MHIHWGEIQKACLNISGQAKVYEPDCIVAVSRGGLIPARLIAERLNIKHIYSVGLSSYTDENVQSTITMYQDPFESIVTNEHKLAIIVDEIADSGNTFKFLSKQWIKHCSTVSCIFAAMFVKEHCQTVPSILYKKVSNDSWLIFPWEANY